MTRVPRRLRRSAGSRERQSRPYSAFGAASGATLKLYARARAAPELPLYGDRRPNDLIGSLPFPAVAVLAWILVGISVVSLVALATKDD